MKIKRITLFISLMLLFGCQSESPTEVTHTSPATLTWTGAEAMDGCGFLIEMNGARFKATNAAEIPEHFAQFDSIFNVNLTYLDTGKQTTTLCGDSPFIENVHFIEILKIEQ